MEEIANVLAILYRRLPEDAHALAHTDALCCRGARHILDLGAHVLQPVLY